MAHAAGILAARRLHREEGYFRRVPVEAGIHGKRGRRQHGSERGPALRRPAACTEQTESESNPPFEMNRLFEITHLNHTADV